MSRMVWAILSALVLAIAGTSGAAAQIGCQPTLTQPCAKPANKPNTPSNQSRTNTSRTDDSNEPIDRSPRVKVDQDTNVKFGTGGIGFGRKF